MNIFVAAALIGVTYIVILGILRLGAIILSKPEFQEVQGKGLGINLVLIKWMTIWMTVAFVGSMVILLILWMTGSL